MKQENKNMALLVMDVQSNIVGRLEKGNEYVEKVTAAVAAAHKSEIPVIYVVVGFRAGLPEVGARNKSFSALKGSMGASMVDPRPTIEPVEGDVVVVKRRVSAFTGSDLEVILRAKEIKHIVLAGISTSGVVLSTVREASDKDYQITVLGDLCADFDPEVHSVLMEKVLPRQADVIMGGEWMKMV
jgi:nicotinamidase-related amidase